jgi:hypothetical protein
MRIGVLILVAGTLCGLGCRHTASTRAPMTESALPVEQLPDKVRDVFCRGRGSFGSTIDHVTTLSWEGQSVVYRIYFRDANGFTGHAEFSPEGVMYGQAD